MSATPAGWYPDPTGGLQLRQWDGAAWTEATRQLPPPMAGPTTPARGAPPVPDRGLVLPSRSSWNSPVVLIIVAIVGAFLIFALASASIRNQNAKDCAEYASQNQGAVGSTC